MNLHRLDIKMVMENANQPVNYNSIVKPTAKDLGWRLYLKPLTLFRFELSPGLQVSQGERSAAN